MRRKTWVKIAKGSGLCYTYVMGIWKSKNRHVSDTRVKRLEIQEEL